MNIGLVLSGGMAKGAYQVGALRALNDFVPLNEIKYMSCASIGVLNGYAYATEHLDMAEEMWRSFCSESAKILVTKALRSDVLQQDIINLCAPRKPLPSTFYCALLDLSRRNIIYKDLSVEDGNKIPLYLKASVAMPIYNRSVPLDDTSYYDGAIVDNIPVYPLLTRELDYIILICFDDNCYKFENTQFDNKIIKITFPATNMLKDSVLFEQDAIDEMLEIGYNKTADILKAVFAEGYDNLAYIYDAIETMNEGGTSSLRLTGDVLVTNLNKLAQRLARRKIT